MPDRKLDDYPSITDSEIMTRKEELHPDLRDYVTAGPLDSPMIKHPLVISLFQDLKRCGLVNTIYEHKKIKKKVLLASNEENLQEYVFLHERPFRLSAFYDYLSESPRGRKVPPKEYWEAVRSIWLDTEFPNRQHARWVAIFNHPFYLPTRQQYIMTLEERELLDRQSGSGTWVIVYRGSSSEYPESESSLSWTLDETKAEWFAKRFTRPGTRPRVTEGMVHKEFVIALFTGRDEMEIVSEHVTIGEYWYLDEE